MKLLKAVIKDICFKADSIPNSYVYTYIDALLIVCIAHCIVKAIYSWRNSQLLLLILLVVLHILHACSQVILLLFIAYFFGCYQQLQRYNNSKKLHCKAQGSMEFITLRPLALILYYSPLSPGPSGYKVHRPLGFEV